MIVIGMMAMTMQTSTLRIAARLRAAAEPPIERALQRLEDDREDHRPEHRAVEGQQQPEEGDRHQRQQQQEGLVLEGGVHGSPKPRLAARRAARKASRELATRRQGAVSRDRPPSFSMKRIGPALAWAWIALVISICAASPSLRVTSASARELLDVALGQAARQVLEDEGDGGAALHLAELQRLQQRLLGHVAQHAGHVAAVQPQRDVLEGEHGALHVLGERRAPAPRGSRGSPRAPRSRCCSSARRSGRPGGAWRGCAAGPRGSRARWRPGCWRRSADRASAPATAAARWSGRSRARAARARSRPPRRASRSG